MEERMGRKICMFASGRTVSFGSKFIASGTKTSTKSYENETWKLGLYSLELPWQTDIDIVEITD